MVLYPSKNTRNVNRIVHHLLNMYLYEKFIFKTASVHFSTFEKITKKYRTCTHERFFKFFVAIEVLPPTTLKKHAWSDLACSKLFLLQFS